ncbi:putative Rossmann fold flavoprotein [Croceifilum oryzae]|uniref:Rossmann fold flavoprotein n=1 Tax=Croceifilum oryzae TaxID=1553429 RepID=A0AAJ1TLY8_9BACL|nr:NAD(P)/FAD-dependent oxidoreductase [Croceifilum oryzae]MDQ0417105.1 putative Rossmann fold flavoprotein [Croceifilum oryzae]
MKYDVIVIGGGPSGLMASAAAGMHGAKVLLLDKGDQLGRKLAISGGGRCNVTNIKDIDELIRFIPGNGRFLYSVFSVFNNWDIVHFFRELGVELKEEDNGRMFPVSDSAKSVVQALIRKVKEGGAQIRVNTPVRQVLYQDGQVTGVESMSGEIFQANQVIIAVGGKSVPQTGSTGDGYAWAEAAGHTITELFPTEVPLTSEEPWILDKSMQGLSLRDITVTVWNAKGKKLVSHDGDLLFTHFGLSGPTALRCSQFVIKNLKKFSAPTTLLTIDVKPEDTVDEIEKEIHKRVDESPKRAFRNALKGYLPERIIPVLFQMVDLSDTLSCTQTSKEVQRKVAEYIKAFPVQVNGTLPLDKAFVTGGGVHIKEIDPRTMQSKIMSGLYFCGEILDIHGYTGGYNITSALCTGYVAGKSATE